MSTAQLHQLSASQLEEVARLFSVLSEPSRLALLQALRGGPRTVGELMSDCRLKQANVSKHLAVLRESRLVSSRRKGTSIRYEIADPLVFGLCGLVCGKLKKEARRSAAMFDLLPA